MAGYGAFQFKPASQGDWAQYAGFDRTTGEQAGQAAQQGVPPPENFQGYLDQRFSGVKDKMAAIPNAMQQAGQGNFSKAIGMIKNPAAPVLAAPALAPLGTPAEQVSAPTSDYDYLSGLAP